MDEELLEQLSSTDDGNPQFEDIPSRAVSKHCSLGLVTLTDDDSYVREQRDGGREPEGMDDEDEVCGTDSSVAGDATSIEV